MIEALKRLGKLGKPAFSSKARAPFILLEDGWGAVVGEEIVAVRPVEVSGGRACVGDDKFFSLLNRLSGELEMKVEGEELILKAGKSRASLPLLPDEVAEEVVALLEKWRKAGWRECRKEVLDGMKILTDAVSFSASAAGFLRSIHLSEQFMEVGDPACVVRLNIPTGMEALIPGKMVDSLAVLVPDEWAEDEAWVGFKKGDELILIRRIDIPYPDVDSIMEHFSSGRLLKVEATELDLALSRAEAFSSIVEVELARRRMKIRAESTGRFEEVLSVEWRGGEQRFRLDGRVLRRLLKLDVEEIRVTERGLKMELRNGVALQIFEEAVA